MEQGEFDANESSIMEDAKATKAWKGKQEVVTMDERKYWSYCNFTKDCPVKSFEEWCAQ